MVIICERQIFHELVWKKYYTTFGTFFKKTTAISIIVLAAVAHLGYLARSVVSGDGLILKLRLFGLGQVTRWIGLCVPDDKNDSFFFGVLPARLTKKLIPFCH